VRNIKVANGSFVLSEIQAKHAQERVQRNLVPSGCERSLSNPAGIGKPADPGQR
jgi:hypothetical protein